MEVPFVLWHLDKVEGTHRTHADDFSSGVISTVDTPALFILWYGCDPCSCQHFACLMNTLVWNFTITPSNSYILPGGGHFAHWVFGYVWHRCARPQPREGYNYDAIYHRASLSEHALLFLSWHTNRRQLTAGFVTVCCSMSMVSKLCAVIFSVKEATTLHTRLD